MGEYTDKLLCHCKREALMLHRGDSIYHCSHCSTSVKLFREEAPPEWYSAEVMRSSEFPLCLECGRNMTGSGVCILDEGEKYYEIIGFVCKANDIHPKRKLGGYGRETSRDVYREARYGAREMLLQWAVEGRLMNIQGVSEMTVADATKILFDTILLTPARDVEGTRILDLAVFPPEDQRLCRVACEYYSNHGLIHSLAFNGTVVSLRPDELLSNRLAGIQNESEALN